jgi:hypothetical protein|tara:strand:- start:1577 stop:1810 length:234 start_codon:yes stop_codon:yes gene_type:complete
METVSFVHFAKEFVEANKMVSNLNPNYCSEFPLQYKNASMISFDTNFGDSFGENEDIFAAKAFVPYNCVKIQHYDYI